MTSTVGAVVLRVQELGLESEFWQAALDYVEREPAEETWVSLRPRHGDGVLLSLDMHRSEYGLPPRVHLDLFTEDQAAEVERLVGLGARSIPLEHRGEVD